MGIFKQGQSQQVGRQQNGATPAASHVKLLNITRGTQLASRLEVADRDSTRTKGLLGRKGLEAGGGLWIVPCEAVHTFFMRFSIDLVYIDRQHRIRKVRSNVPPWRLSGCLAAHSVIELPPGVIERTQSRAGDQLEFAADEAEPS